MWLPNLGGDTPYRPRRAQVRDGWLSYTVAGRGRPVILIHGLGGSTRWWQNTMAPLARHFRVYSIDLVGFGDSQSGQPFVLAEAAEILAEWMDQVGIDCAFVIGHSMGGYIAAELAADYPAKVERLVLVDAAAPMTRLSLVRHLFGLAQEVTHTPPTLLSMVATDFLRAGPQTIWKAAWELRDNDIQPKLAAIQAPTLVVWGEHDKLTPLDIGHTLAEIVPNAKLLIIKKCGHTPMWECPDIFNQVVLDFLSPDTLLAPRRALTARQMRPAPPLKGALTRLAQLIQSE